MRTLAGYRISHQVFYIYKYQKYHSSFSSGRINVRKILSVVTRQLLWIWSTVIKQLREFLLFFFTGTIIQLSKWNTVDQNARSQFCARIQNLIIADLISDLTKQNTGNNRLSVELGLLKCKANIWISSGKSRYFFTWELYAFWNKANIVRIQYMF